MEETEGTGQVELGIHVVVDLRVHLSAVGLKRALGEVVAALPVDVVGGNVARDLLRDRVHPAPPGMMLRQFGLDAVLHSE